MNINPFDFSGKVAVVTGGSGVLCGELCRALGQRGAGVAVVAHSRFQNAQRVAAEIEAHGGRARAFRADVLDKRALERLAEDVLNAFGRIDALINGAGGAHKDATTGPHLPFFDLPEEAVRHVFDLNFLGTFFACQVFGRVLQQQEAGVILNISSRGAVRPLTRSVAYSAAKAAVSNFTEWLAVHMAQEYGPGVRVNALVPGFFLTDQNRFLLTDERSGSLTERGRRIVEHTPMARFGAPADLVGPALFLLSHAAAFVHGATLVVDGGLNAYGGV